MKSRIKKLHEEALSLHQRSIEDNVKDRLNKSLSLYVDNLLTACDRLQCKKSSTVYKEINR